MIEGCTENSRGLGVSDMPHSLRKGGAPQASGELGYHIMDVMHGALDSSERGQFFRIQSRFERPAPLGSDHERCTGFIATLVAGP